MNLATKGSMSQHYGKKGKYFSLPSTEKYEVGVLGVVVFISKLKYIRNIDFLQTKFTL